jgi:hypothetical protein
MAFKLNKQELTDLQALIDAYKNARSSLADRLDEIAADWESDFADKSEKWQEGEAGQIVLERIEMVRGWHDEFQSECDIDMEALV